MNKQNENYLKALLSLLSMAFLIYIGSSIMGSAKLDFTEENLYTLSDGTKSILGKLDTTVKLKLYYSKTAANKGSEGLRTFNNHYTYVRELLKEYISHSRNNLSLQVVDPRPDTPEEEDAMSYGLKKFQLTDTERYFFGLVAENETGTEKIIEFFNPGEKDKLEYQLTKLIFTVLNPQKKNIGILSSLEVLNEDVSPYMAQIMRMQGKGVNDSWISIKMLKELFEVKKIEKEAESITGVDTLVIIHPKGFSEKTLFAIDQYLMKGGKLLVFVDPYAVTDSGRGGYGGVSSSPDVGFQKLMDKWGIEVPASTFAGDKYLSGVGQFSQNQRPTRLLALLNCSQKCTDSYKETISSGVGQTTFVYPGVLKKKEVEHITVTPIMATTKKGNSYKAYGRELSHPPSLWSKFQEGSEPVVIAYKAVGKFKTAFPEGVKSDAVVKEKAQVKKGQRRDAKVKDSGQRGINEKIEVVKESQKESAVVVFADVDFISDQFAFKKTFLGLAAANDNSTLFVNSVEALTGDVDLISVRSKGRVNRSFDVIEEIEFAAEKKTADKVKEINARISKFQTELNQLGRQANEGNIAILQNEGLRKKKELAKSIAGLKKELREVKREGREKIEGIGKMFQYINTLLVPILVILGGLWYSVRRGRRMNRGSSVKKSKSSFKEKVKKIQAAGGQA